MQQSLQQNKKKFGSVSFIDNKVRINYNDGTDSVLFEDISSISYKSIKQPNFLLIGLPCWLLCIILIITNPAFYFFTLFIMVIGTILMFVFPIKFDNVIVETRGGKLLVYSVESGTGGKQMEKIETEKRNQS